MVVGAPGDNDNGENAGSAYVFIKSARGWQQAAKLTASDRADYVWFGNSVAVSGDTVVVGAHSQRKHRSQVPHTFTSNPTQDGPTRPRPPSLRLPTAPLTTRLGFWSGGVRGYRGGRVWNWKLCSSETTALPRFWLTCTSNPMEGGPQPLRPPSLRIPGALLAVRTDTPWRCTGKPWWWGADGATTTALTQAWFTCTSSLVGGWATVTETAGLTQSDSAPYDAFGFSGVSLSDRAILVGAAGDDDNGSESGSALRVRQRAHWRLGYPMELYTGRRQCSDPHRGCLGFGD